MKLFIRTIVGLALAGVAISFLVLTGFGYTWTIAFPVAVLAAFSVHEIQGVTGCKARAITHPNMVFSAITPFYFAFREQIEEVTFAGFGRCLTALYVITMLIVMLKMYEKTRFENVAIGIFSSIALTYSISTIMLLVFFLEDYPDYFSRSMIIYIVLMVMFCAWLTDSLSLFSGMAFGKHKLSRKISPKKTVEGAVGGVLGTLVCGLIAYFICSHFFFHYDTIKVWMVIVLMPIISVVGICGDLAASVVKRNYGAKDFGTMFPEHGGMMDRIDSFVFAMPFAYVLIKMIVSFAF